jgi:tetratricopeptide (TPR) repeat protein
MKHTAWKRIGSLAAVVLLAGGFAFGQAGRGVGRLGGVVYDLEEKPIEGVKLTLQFSDNANLKFEAASNKKGEWSFLGLGTGNWTLTATVTGYMPQDKTLYVSQLSQNPKVVIHLQKVTKGAGVVADEATFAILEKANQLFKEAKFDEAIASYQDFLAKNPNLYQVQLSIADCLREKAEFDKAIETYKTVVEQAKLDATLGKEMTAKALAGIGNCYLKQGKMNEAQDLFRQSIENSPKDEVLAYNVGEIYFSNQALDDALRYFNLAAQIKPDWPDPYLKLGYVYLNKPDNAKAIESFEKFLTLEPEGNRAGLARNILNVIKK